MSPKLIKLGAFFGAGLALLFGLFSGLATSSSSSSSSPHMPLVALLLSMRPWRDPLEALARDGDDEGDDDEAVVEARCGLGAMSGLVTVLPRAPRPDPDDSSEPAKDDPRGARCGLASPPPPEFMISYSSPT